MDTTKCINNSQWEAYSKGQLDQDHLTLLKTHASACEICADIKEGIDAMKNPSKLSEQVSSIHKKIDIRVSEKKGRIIPFIYWSAAASILIVAGFFLFRVDNQIKNEQILVQVEPKTNTQESPAPISKETIAPAPIISKKSNLALSTKQAETPKLVTSKKSEISVIEKPEMLSEAREIKPEIVETKQISNTNQESDLTRRETFDDVAGSKEKAGSKEMSTIQKKQQRAVFPSNSYSNNAESNVSNQALTSNSNASDLFLLNRAQLQFTRHQYDSAINTLEPILGSKQNPLYEEALWIQAQSFKEKGDSKNAKKVFKIIIELKGKHALEAKKELG